MPQIFLNISGFGKRCISFRENETLAAIYERTKVPYDDCYIIHDGKLVELGTNVYDDQTYHILPRIKGGKGGFGSMLRALGAQIEKTTNREACRDLSGRRMRDVNNEQSLRDWVSKAADREREKEQRRRERLERRKAEPHHQFNDQNYMQQKAQVAEGLEDAIQEGLQRASASCSTATCTATSTSRKRKSEEAGPSSGTAKRRFDWMGDGISLSDLESDSDQDEPKESNSDLAGDVEPAPVGVEDSESSHEEQCHESHSDSGVESVAEIRIKDSPMDIDSCGSEKDSALNSDADAADMLSENQSPEMQTDHSTESDRDVMAVVSVPLAVQYPPSPPQLVDPSSVDLMSYDHVEELESLGLDTLKAILMARGLKCGGTLQQRVQRLWSVRGVATEEIDPSLVAKPSKGKGKRR